MINPIRSASAFVRRLPQTLRCLPKEVSVFRRTVHQRPFTTAARPLIQRDFRPLFWAAGAVLAGTGLYHLSKESKEVSFEELQNHADIENGLWIYWKDPADGLWYVSSMADYVASHPGGKRILEAGAKGAMPFWQQFARHLDVNGNPAPHVLEEVRKRVVGVLDQPPPIQEMADPYALEPDRSQCDLSIMQQKPFNAGQKPEKLDCFITDIEKMFVRFHTPAPLLDNHSLKIQVGDESVHLTQENLKQFEPISFTSVLQCTGHRRSEMSQVAKTDGIQWESAVANVEVEGVRLWDVLKSQGVKPEAGKYLVATQLDEKGLKLFSTCIPLQDVPENALLVHKMNGEKLTRDHGGPLRLFVPGFNGNFSVKKPTQIQIVSERDVKADPKYSALGKWAHAAALSENLVPYIENRKGEFFFESELRVNSMAQVGQVNLPSTAANLPINGWAWSGGGREITAVEVSADEGQTWQTTSLDPVIQQPTGKRYAWTSWAKTIPIAPDTTCILIRAKDSAGNIQPEKSGWNPRGLRNNSYTKIKIFRD
jgi:sulfite oxidase